MARSNEVGLKQQVELKKLSEENLIMSANFTDIPQGRRPWFKKKQKMIQNQS
jgi:hypothetical protein